MWLLFPLIALALVVLVLAGIVAAVAVTAALVVAAIVRALPFLLIVVAVWWLAKALRGPRQPAQYRGRSRQAYQARPTWTPRSGQTVHDQPAPPPRPAATRRPAGRPRELPIDIQVKVEQIRSKADVLAGYADRFPPFSQDLYIVRQTTADYLPRTIEAYLAVPHTDDPPLGGSSAAALGELRTQLDLLDTRLDDIAHDLQRHDLDQLYANRRFLEERFGRRDQPTETAPSGGKTGAA